MKNSVLLIIFVFLSVQTTQAIKVVAKPSITEKLHAQLAKRSAKGFQQLNQVTPVTPHNVGKQANSGVVAAEDNTNSALPRMVAKNQTAQILEQ